MKIGIISDTHGKLRPEVVEALQGVDAILHGGDVCSQKLLDALSAIAPLYAVRGNNDKTLEIPYVLNFTLGGLRFFMVHKKADLPACLPEADIVIYGHSHKYAQEVKDGVLYLNPGSCGPRRFHQEITMALMTIENGTYFVEKLVIPQENGKENPTHDPCTSVCP